MIVLNTLWATVLSQNTCTPYLAVSTPAYSSSKNREAEAPVNLPGGPAFHSSSSVRQGLERSAVCAQSWDISFVSFELNMYHGWKQSQGYDFLPSSGYCRAGGLTHRQWRTAG